MAEDTSSVISRQLSVFLVAGILLEAPAAAQTSLSIYSDGRVVVRRTLPQALDKGKNTLTLKLDDLDVATLFSPDSSVAVLSAVLRPATDEATALRRAVDRSRHELHRRAVRSQRRGGYRGRP